MTLAWQAEHALDQMKPVQQAGKSVALGIHHFILAGGEPTRKIADFLHGVWLGHPLHPVLTDITVGAWTLGTMLDLAGEVTDSDALRSSADHATLIGTASAIPTAITGMVDYSTIPKRFAAPATVHAVINLINFGLYAGSVQARRNGNRRKGLILSSIAFGMTMASAWIGGSLVYRHKIGTNHADPFSKPKRFVPVAKSDCLDRQNPNRIEYDGKPVLLYRDDERDALYAIGNTCAHAAGQLHEGEIQGHCVQCPKHQSVFDMRNGKVVHGPACQPVAAFDARVRNGNIEIRLQPNHPQTAAPSSH
jgi:nitrite reductase/ring-hydroxylating ferredoxin subunit/uncharacterized membrane protein